MSLTGELGKENSSVSLYFKNNFKINDFLEENNSQLKGIYTLFPKNTDNYPWSDVGHIVEYLMVLHMGLSIPEIFPIKTCFRAFNLGNFELNIKKKYTSEYLDDCFKKKEDFKVLCEDLYRCSKIESAWRSAKNISNKDLTETKMSSVMFSDILNIYGNSIRKNEIINNPENYFHYNPTFDLSSNIGGADADLYLKNKNGNFLIDLKTTVKPKIQDSMIFQLLGYVFLDASNKHNIKDVGIYLTRQNLISKWSVDDIINKHSIFSDIEEAKTCFFLEAIKNKKTNKI